MNNHLNIFLLCTLLYALSGCAPKVYRSNFVPRNVSSLRVGHTTRAKSDSLLGYPQIIFSFKHQPPESRCWVYYSDPEASSPLVANGTVGITLSGAKDTIISGRGNIPFVQDKVISGHEDTTFVERFSPALPQSEFSSGGSRAIGDSTGSIVFDSVYIESASWPFPDSASQLLVLEFAGDTLNGCLIDDSTRQTPADSIAVLPTNLRPHLTTLIDATTLLGRSSAEFLLPSAIVSALERAGFLGTIPAGTTRLLIYARNLLQRDPAGSASSVSRRLVLCFNADGLLLGQKFIEASTK
jgi:hypothetical protein